MLRTLHGDRLREADLRGIGERGMGVSGGSTSSIGSLLFTALKGTPVSYLGACLNNRRPMLNTLLRSQSSS